MADANTSLIALYKILRRAHDQLHERRSATGDPELADAMLTELREITHRIDLVQSQLFTDQSERIAKGVIKVEKANVELEGALKKVTRVRELVSACTSFLKVVDRVIDLAKTIA